MITGVIGRWRSTTREITTIASNGQVKTVIMTPPPCIIAVDVDGDGLRFTFEDGQSYHIDGQQLAALVGPVLMTALGQATGVDREDDEVPF